LDFLHPENDSQDGCSLPSNCPSLPESIEGKVSEILFLESGGPSRARKLERDGIVLQALEFGFLRLLGKPPGMLDFLLSKSLLDILFVLTSKPITKVQM
jgi:hypothetical protein